MSDCPWLFAHIQVWEPNPPNTSVRLFNYELHCRVIWVGSLGEEPLISQSPRFVLWLVRFPRECSSVPFIEGEGLAVHCLEAKARRLGMVSTSNMIHIPLIPCFWYGKWIFTTLNLAQFLSLEKNKSSFSCQDCCFLSWQGDLGMTSKTNLQSILLMSVFLVTSCLEVPGSTHFWAVDPE